jgi:hypothetical protein
MVKQLPNWVLGGEFGDISNLLTDRDQRTANLRRDEQLNTAREIDLENKQREAELEREIRNRGIFGGNDQGPITLRDMYGRVRDTAAELGSYEDAIRMQEKIESLERQQQQDELSQRVRESMIESRNRGGTRGSGGGGSKRLFTLENPETGEKGIFLPDEANEKLQQGWDIYKRDDLADILGGGNKKGPEKPSEPGATGRFLEGLLGGKKPGEDPAKEQEKLVEGIKDQAATINRPARPPKPGMKWIRNKKTGELREVPE